MLLNVDGPVFLSRLLLDRLDEAVTISTSRAVDAREAMTESQRLDEVPEHCSPEGG